MLINGQKAVDSQAGILNQLASLKSSFPNYLSAKPVYSLSEKEVGLYNGSLGNYAKGEKLTALGLCQELEESMPKDHPNNQFLQSVYRNIGTMQYELGNFTEAGINFQKSASQCMATKNFFNAETDYKFLADTYKAAGTLENYEKENQAALEKSLDNKDQSAELSARLALGGVNRATGNHEEALRQYAVAYDLQQGEVDYQADRVEQHEVGFSDKKIGTDNIQQCVAVILHDPITKKTALAHVDKLTETKSLADVIEKFGKGTQLNAYLVGGRDRSAQSKSISDSNIARVMEELGKHATVDIKSADIGDKSAPSGIVFDPQTATLSHAVPGKHHETTSARKLLHNLKPPLNFAFDLTKSPEMQGPVLSDLDKASLVHRCLNTPKNTTINNSNETWNANIMYDPLVKTVEKIRRENPEIVRSVAIQHFDYKLNQELSKVPISKQHSQEIKLNFFSDLQKKLKNPNKSFSQIQQEFETNMPVRAQQRQSTLGSVFEFLENTSDNITSAIKNIKTNLTKTLNATKEFLKNPLKTIKELLNKSPQALAGDSPQIIASQENEPRAPQANQAIQQKAVSDPVQQKVVNEGAKTKVVNTQSYSPNTVNTVNKFRTQSVSKSHSNNQRSITPIARQYQNQSLER